MKHLLLVSLWVLLSRAGLLAAPYTAPADSLRPPFAAPYRVSAPSIGALHAPFVERPRVSPRVVTAPAVAPFTPTRRFSSLPATPAEIFTAPDVLVPLDLQQGGGLENKLVAKAKALRQKIKDAKKFIENFDPNIAVDLPVGIRKVIGNTEYILCIDSISLRPDAAYLTAYLAVDLPEGTSNTPRTLTFMGRDIRFSKTGGLGEAKITLLETVELNPDAGQKTLMRIKGGETYVIFDCNGFKEMNLVGEVDFSRDLMEPLTDAGAVVPAPARVKA